MNRASITLLIALLLWCSPSHAQPYELEVEPESNIQFKQFPFEEYQVHYAYSGNASKAGIIFIHGTPGSWHAFQRYLNNKELQRDYFLVSIDRLGWGKSNARIESNENSSQNSSTVTPSPTSFALQAKSILALMQQYPEKNWILAGHSLGASIAPKVALLDGDKINGLLLLSGSLKPSLGKPRWFNRIANTLLVSWMLPSHWRYSNMEIMGLQDELTSIEIELEAHSLDIPVVVIQGMRDRLVSPKNAAYVLGKWPQSFRQVDVVQMQDAGHFIPWKQSPAVLEKLREFPQD